MKTEDEDYAARLVAKQDVAWKRVLHVQAPYQWNLRRQRLGRTLEIGCGIGRNLASLGDGSIGVDHNEAAVDYATSRGLVALTPPQFRASKHAKPDSFDGLLVAHVLEHLTPDAARSLLLEYLGYVKPGGRAFLICPQERGFTSDQTHVTWFDGPSLERLAQDVGLQTQGWMSFPLPRRFGKLFIYNEFTVLGVKG